MTYLFQQERSVHAVEHWRTLLLDRAVGEIGIARHGVVYGIEQVNLSGYFSEDGERGVELIWVGCDVGEDDFLFGAFVCQVVQDLVSEACPGLIWNCSEDLQVVDPLESFADGVFVLFYPLRKQVLPVLKWIFLCIEIPVDQHIVLLWITPVIE